MGGNGRILVECKFICHRCLPLPSRCAACRHQLLRRGRESHPSNLTPPCNRSSAEHRAAGEVWQPYDTLLKLAKHLAYERLRSPQEGREPANWTDIQQGAFCTRSMKARHAPFCTMLACNPCVGEVGHFSCCSSYAGGICSYWFTLKRKNAGQASRQSLILWENGKCINN